MRWSALLLVPLFAVACEREPASPDLAPTLGTANAPGASGIEAASIHDLGPLPGTSLSLASGINDRGDVVGVGIGSNTYAVAVIWPANGPASSLGHLPGDDYSQAWAVSNSGEVVGSSGSITAGSVRAALWVTGVGSSEAIDLGGGASSSAFDINDTGVIVGFDGMWAVVWHRDGSSYVKRYLPTLSSENWHGASAVNNRGEAVGASSFSDGTYHAVLWLPTSSSTATITDLGAVIGDDFSSAADINERGDIVGDYGTLGAVIWRRTAAGFAVDTLGMPAGWSVVLPLGISERGDVVGGGLVEREGVWENRAFAWTKEVGFVELPSLGTQCSTDGDCSFAEGINSRGWIAGRSWGGDDNHAVRWVLQQSNRAGDRP